MRGDVVFRVYGLHEGREADSYFGAFRSRAEADAQIAELAARTMHGENWAARYHNRGFVVREHPIPTDFEFPSRPKPRDRYLVKTTARPNRPGTWDSTVVEVLRRKGDALERVGEYVRNYSMLSTFEPFRQGERELALISREYTKTAVLDLASGEVIAEETESSPGAGFCPVGGPRSQAAKEPTPARPSCHAGAEQSKAVPISPSCHRASTAIRHPRWPRPSAPPSPACRRGSGLRSS